MPKKLDVAALLDATTPEDNKALLAGLLRDMDPDEVAAAVLAAWNAQSADVVRLIETLGNG